jgi:hypothetical protein
MHDSDAPTIKRRFNERFDEEDEQNELNWYRARRLMQPSATITTICHRLMQDDSEKIQLHQRKALDFVASQQHLRYCSVAIETDQPV